MKTLNPAPIRPTDSVLYIAWPTMLHILRPVRPLFVTVLLLMTLFGVFATPVHADGTEELKPPQGIQIATTHCHLCC